MTRPLVTWDGLRREPFRILFPLGAVFGIVGVGHWLFYALGWSASYSGFYHASVQMGAFMVCFIAGFLMTALPRFTVTKPATSMELGAVLLLVVSQLLLSSVGRWVAAEACFATLLAVLAAFAFRRGRRRHAETSPPVEFVWIPVALAHGLIGTALLAAGQLGAVPSWLLGVGRPMLQHGFVLGVVLGVGGFMSARLMGHVLTQATPWNVDAKATPRLRRRRIRWHLIGGLLLFASFWIEGAGFIQPAYGLRAAVVTTALGLTAGFHRPPRTRDFYVRMLWAALWLIVTGLWAVGLLPRYRVVTLHISFLGGLSLMVFAVATMVVLSHAGEGRRLQRPLWVLRLIATGVTLALLTRIVAELRPTAFFAWLGVATVCWVVPVVAWLGFILPKVLRPIPEGEFERVHEEAKRRLQPTAQFPAR